MNSNYKVLLIVCVVAGADPVDLSPENPAGVIDLSSLSHVTRRQEDLSTTHPRTDVPITVKKTQVQSH